MLPPKSRQIAWVRGRVSIQLLTYPRLRVLEWKTQYRHIKLLPFCSILYPPPIVSIALAHSKHFQSTLMHFMQQISYSKLIKLSVEQEQRIQRECKSTSLRAYFSFNGFWFSISSLCIKGYLLSCKMYTLLWHFFPTFIEIYHI